MITCKVRFSYLTVFEPKPNPSGQLKYSVCLLIPKEDQAGVQDIKQAIQKAVNKGIETGKFNAAAVKHKSFKLALRDGDEEFEDGNRGPEYKGHFFLNASSDNKPGLADKRSRPIMDETEFYSGCYGYADINFFPFNTNGNKGIGVGVNNLMKWEDGDRLDGRQSAQDAFAHLAVQDDEDDTEGEVDDDLT